MRAVISRRPIRGVSAALAWPQIGVPGKWKGTRRELFRLVRGPAYYRECNLGERGSLERSSGDQLAFRGV